MKKQARYIFLLAIFLIGSANKLFAQQPAEKQDTFFLAKKKGILGRLGRSISTTPPDKEPEKIENPFLKYKGRRIRSVIIVNLGFGSNIYDTTYFSNNIGVRIANALHKNTRPAVIFKNLFFKPGSTVYPYLLADNERYLRQLEYIQDARINVKELGTSNDSVDVIIITKDVFSIGGKVAISSKTEGRLEFREENMNGSGNQILLSGYYDKQRKPDNAFGGELIERNIGGSFINWTTGYKDYNSNFSNGRNEETGFYSRLEKPLVTPYIPATGALEGGYYKTSNAYDSVRLYKMYYNYEYYNADGWFGYSLDSKRSIYANKEIRVHRFIAARAFLQHFITVPDTFKTIYDYRFANVKGALASLNIFKQVFYKTTFIYGFGVNEDVPEGFSASITAGMINKQNTKRPYAGADVEINNFVNRGFHSTYIFRAGGFFNKHRFEDADLLFNVEHFTRLRRISSTWFQRTFVNAGITAQVNPSLNGPLLLNSNFGLPYFDNGDVNSDLRGTVRAESVFYNTDKVLGFRFAPFVFADISALKQTKMSLKKTDMYSAIGGGVRTRNENLTFGTVELRGYYFPRRIGDMHGWKIEVNSNIRFRYNSTFIKRPDFIIAN
ncbi:MAG: hypothetical protein ABJA78_16250 [Ferruginibacter sp.]